MRKMDKIIIKFKKDYELLGVVAKKKGDTLEVIKSNKFPFEWETFGEGLNIGIAKHYAEEISKK